MQGSGTLLTLRARSEDLFWLLPDPFSCISNAEERTALQGRALACSAIGLAEQRCPLHSKIQKIDFREPARIRILFTYEEFKDIHDMKICYRACYRAYAPRLLCGL
jgi:hypothetical protein